MSAVQRHVDRQAATDAAYRAYLQHLETCIAACREVPAVGAPVRCPKGAALYRVYRTARDAS